MPDSIYQKTITIGRQTFSYDTLISQSNLGRNSINLANEYLARYSDPKKAAKHLLHNFSVKSALGCLPDLLPPDEENNNVRYSAEFTLTLHQILLALAIAYLAGFDPCEKEVWLFILGNFFSASTNSTNITSTDEFAERTGYALAHGIFNIAGSEAIGHRAYKYFFENKRSSKRYRKFL